MFKFKKVVTALLIGSLLIPIMVQAAMQATSSANIVLSPVEQAKKNYLLLTTPPNVNTAAKYWLVYFGPSARQAKTSKVAASKRYYVEQHSPLKAIPTRLVKRTVTWITLSAAQQLTLSRSTGNSFGSDKTSSNIYGY